MTPDRRVALARVLLFVTPLVWTANYIIARRAVGVIAPHQLALLRWSLAFVLMMPFALPSLRRHWPAWRTEWKDLLVMGALGMWICGAWVYVGARTTTATNIGLLYALAPVLIAIGGVLFLREPFSPLQGLGALLAMAGTVTILAKGSLDTLRAVDFTVGDLWILAATIAWATYSILLRARPSVLDPFARLTAITAGGIAVLVPLTSIEIAVTGLPPDTAHALWLGVIAAVLPGVVAYQSYSFIQRELGAAKTGLILYLGPLYAAGVAWLLLGEQPHWYHALGAAMILPGLWLATRRSR